MQAQQQGIGEICANHERTEGSNPVFSSGESCIFREQRGCHSIEPVAYVVLGRSTAA
jgi:hypothetical protein